MRNKSTLLNYQTALLALLLCLASIICASAETDPPSRELVRRTGTLEVLYRWQEPTSDVDQIVFKRLHKTLTKEKAYYYYIMYARCKEDILVSRTPKIVHQRWLPEKVLLDGKKIKYQKYLKLINYSPRGRYRIVYYQETPDGLLKLGEQLAGSGDSYIPDLTFVTKVTSAIGKESPSILWYSALAGVPVIAYLEYTRQQREKEKEDKEEERLKIPPVASFIPTPITGTLATAFYFDASSSYDPHEPASNLQVRWDWENNGTWDTTFSPVRTTSHSYALSTTYTVKLQVIDSGGHSSLATQTIWVIDNGSALDTTAPHPMFRHNITHTALSTQSGPLTNTLKWSYPTDNEIASSPAIGPDGTIYIGSGLYSNKLYALNPDGTDKWPAFPAGGPIWASPALTLDGTIYIGSGDGKLYAINSTTGAEIWNYNAGPGVWFKSSPAIGLDGTIYVGATNGKLYAINPNSTLKWTYPTGNWIESSPAIGNDNTIYIGSADKKLYAINPNSTLKWTYPTGGAISSSPAIGSDGTIYVGSLDTYLYAINSNGTLKWKRVTGGNIYSSPAIGSDGTIYVGSDDFNLYALNPADGKDKWTPFITGGAIRSSPLIDNNNPPHIYFGSYDGNIYAITDTGSSGVKLWNYGPISTINSSPAITGTGSAPILYIGCDDGNIYALGSGLIDPAEISITKKANKKTISIGDIITYNITIPNRGVDPAVTATLTDIIPAGFKYIEGSAYLDNVLLPTASITRTLPATKKKGRTVMYFDLNGVPTGTMKTLSYQLVVGSGVTFGKYENKAYCNYFDIQWKQSNIARETVEVVADPLFDLGTIIGKVFIDTNGNGIQDDGEPGLGGVRIATEEGTVITTDEDGKYHVPGVKPGVHLLKIDTRSIKGTQISADLTDKSSATISENQRTIVTENPRVLRVTPGMLHKINFGIQNSTQINADLQDKNSGSSALISENQRPNSDFFLVALGDGEIGSNNATGNLEPIKDSDTFDDGFYARGRVAYYLKGKVKGKYLITSSLDTDRKNKELFRYIDPDKYYPVYGDASNISFDATNTQGVLYLMVEDIETGSSLLWGNYHTEFTGNELANYNRTLYGAKLEVRSQKSEARSQTNIKVFGASALQQSAHAEFLATGGSLYYLKHKNIVEGSDKVVVQVRDKVTDMVIASEMKLEGQDYDIDYSNGRVLFYRPIHSITESGSIISSGILDGNHVYVTVDYEYEVPEYHFREGTYGARVNQELPSWGKIGFNIGGSYVKEQKDNRDYKLTSIDSLIKVSDLFDIKAEYAESRTEAVNNFVSTDGGLSFNQIAHPSQDKGAAYSIRATSQPIRTIAPALGEVTFESYYKKLDPEFSSYQDINQVGTKKYGAGINLKPMILEDNLTISARHDIQELDDISRGNLASGASIGAEKTQTTMVQSNYVKDKLSLIGEYRHQESEKRIVGLESETNYDADVWAARAGYQITKKLNVFAEQQHTASGERNHQTTAGGTLRFLDHCNLRLQGTTGTKGESSLVGLDTDVGNKSTVYTSFSQTMAKSHGKTTPQTAAVAGARTQVTPKTRIYSQQEYRTTKDPDTKDKSESHGTVLGLTNQILEKLKVSLSFERTVINEMTGGPPAGEAGQTRRMANALGVKYIDKDKFSLSSGFELRLDDGLVDRNEYLLTNSINYKIDRDFTFLGKVNQSWTENKTTDRTEARFKEHSTGIAYRPVKHDKLNLLGKYTFQDDWYPQNQTGLGTDMSQINHAKAHIYGVEGSYQLNERLEVVEKAAKKLLREKVGPRDYVKSETYLNIHRLNYRMIGKWEVGAEYRILTQKLAEDQKTGYLLEVMYNLHEHISFGVGYNFTDFSDDLTSRNDYSVKGAFLRLIGKF